jgi:L-alanine-DL-glutamate epimerase-like enolase superfamily enzyme
LIPTIVHTSAEYWRYTMGKPITASGVASIDLVVVTLELADGTTGWGFSTIFDGRDDVPVHAARHFLERFVSGQPFDHPVALWRRIAAACNRTGKGPYYTALAAIDVAAWDLYAKQLGVPIGVAMGGTPRRVPVYASSAFALGQDPEEAAALADAYRQRGARGVKIRAGGTPHDARVLHAVAEKLGGAIELMVDANQRCTLTTAARLLRSAAEVGARFVEEPLPASNRSGFELLARTTPVPIACGENLQGTVEAAPFLLGGWCSVIQPDLRVMGGLTECLRTAQFAEHCNVEVAPHYLPGLFIQLAAAVPHLTWLEEFHTIEPMFATMPGMEADGYITLPDTPGHGLVVADGARAAFKIA